MTPAAKPNRNCARWSGGLACAALLQATALAAPQPEVALQLSASLTPPSAAAAERALLRVEYQAAKSREAESDVVGDILVRVRHMEIMVGEVERLMGTWQPTAPVLAAAPANAPAALPLRHSGGVAEPAERAHETTLDISPGALYSLIALAAAATFLAWLWRERYAYLKARRQRSAPALPLVKAAAPPLPPQPRAVVAAAPQAAVPAPEPTADDAVKLADIMLSMGLTHGAAQTLSEQVHEHPRQALFHWFKLLEIYRRSDMRDDFDQAAAELRRYFNVQAQAWPGGGGVDGNGGAVSIEDYPHLAAQLQALWPDAACAAFLAHLLEDNRGGTRNGFPQGVAEEILLLQRLLAAPAPAPVSA